MKREEFLTAGNMEETGVHLLPLCSDSREQCNGIFLFMTSKVKQKVVAFDVQVEFRHSNNIKEQWLRNRSRKDG